MRTIPSQQIIYAMDRCNGKMNSITECLGRNLQFFNINLGHLFYHRIQIKMGEALQYA